MSVGPETRPHEELLQIARSNIRASVVRHMLREQPMDEADAGIPQRSNAVAEAMSRVMQPVISEKVPISL